MRKFKILYTVTSLIGSFSEVVESDTDDDKALKKLLNKKFLEDGILVDDRAPRVREILLVETLSDSEPQ